MDIDCDWCICGKKTSNGRLYCSEECKLSDCASDSSANSDHSYLSNSPYASLATVPTFYNKKMNKNYVALLKANNGSSKPKNFGYHLSTLTSKGYGNNTINHCSPTSQIPLSSKYNQANLARSSAGGLMASNLMPLNTLAVTTHVNTSGHIIKTSTSAPKITEIDSQETSTSCLYNRRYSVPISNNNSTNVTLNPTITVNNQVYTPSIGLLPNANSKDTANVVFTTNHPSSSNYYNCLGHSRSSSNASTNSDSTLSSQDDDKTLHSTQSTSNESSLDHHTTKGISSFSKNLKPISEVTDSSKSTHQSNNQSNTKSKLSPNSSLTANILKNNDSNNNRKKNNSNNNYTLYKTSASTNLCALNKLNNMTNYKMMSGGAKQPLVSRRSLLHSNKTNSVESADSTNPVTPIYF